MKRIILSIMCFCSVDVVNAQELPQGTEQQLEELSIATESETEDDSYLQELEIFRRHPIELNSADADELRQLKILTEQQIQSLLGYRQIFGNLLHIYEMQAIPGWHSQICRRLLPFIAINNGVPMTHQFRERMKGGESSVLLRMSQIFERSKGFISDTANKNYQGSPIRVLFRYKYAFKNLLQFGVLGDKDAGEQFFSGKQKLGFDFYSFHFFVRNIGKIYSLAIGDFTVNMGQGLVHWQSLAFKKSVEVTNIRRQSAVLRPYTSSGEFFFHRGAGITIKRRNIEASTFISIRKLNANVSGENDEDGSVSSLLTSGNNRTLNELADRHSLRQLTAGINVKYDGTGKNGGAWHSAMSAVNYHFSSPLNKRDLPYNKFTIRSDKWYNASIDYSYTYRNFHVFGETAIDARGSIASVNGLLVSMDARADFSLLYRRIPAEYQSVYGNAFTENATPSNEIGMFAGIALRPNPMLKFSFYADHYSFPWLKFRVDAPSFGRDYLIQVTLTPNKQFELYTRYKLEKRESNLAGDALNVLENFTKRNWRTHFNYKLNSSFTVRSRFETSWYGSNLNRTQIGFIYIFDLLCKPLMKPYAFNFRLMRFETDGYDSRLYAYENDVMYSSSVPVFFGSGFRYYFNLNYDVTKSITLWLRFARTTYPAETLIGSGLEETEGNRRTELRIQCRYVF